MAGYQPAEWESASSAKSLVEIVKWSKHERHKSATFALNRETTLPLVVQTVVNRR